MTEYSNQARKFLRKAETLLLHRLLERIARLEKEPFPQECDTVKGEERSLKMRVGNYRIIYQQREQLFIVRIDKRETVY